MTKTRDAVSRKRRALPWVKVDKPYVFEGPNGKETLADLFGGKNQLIIYYFMFGPDWEEGCASCSFHCEGIDEITVHLAHRDVTLLAVSRAPFAQLDAYKKRMGWRFKWVSSYGSDFNFDYNVSFTREQLANRDIYYNYQQQHGGLEEMPGTSVFSKDEAGGIFHTYSSFARGGDAQILTYTYLDLVPKGRDEDGLAFTMAWVRRHDRYDTNYVVDPALGYVQPQVVTRR